MLVLLSVDGEHVHMGFLYKDLLDIEKMVLITCLFFHLLGD